MELNSYNSSERFTLAARTTKRTSRTQSVDTKFKQVVLTAVDEGLSSLGGSSKHAIYFHLENTFQVRREEIPAKPERFAVALEEIFGPGSIFLEKCIVKCLYEKLKLNLEQTEASSFDDYVKVARESYIGGMRRGG